ncbi:hypothetical protein F4861DRAFT_520327 [Xylaria intraflava]|nr:hypothetical protein F4861DRAFT_520327 [Xylaria intraflava]
MSGPSDPEAITHGVLAAGLTLSISAAILRLYTRVFYTEKARIEDYIALAGFGNYIALVVIIFRLEENGGLLIHVDNFDPDELANFVHIFFVGANIYHATLLLLKAAILLEWVHIFVPLGTRNLFFWTSYVIIGISTLYYIISILILNFSCTPRDRYWDMSIPGTCINTSLNNAVTSIFNLFFDVIILALPHMVIWSLNMRTALKFGVSVVFLIGLLACVVAAVRVVVSSEVFMPQDVTYHVSSQALLAFAETTIAIVIFCAPMIPRALKHIWDRARFIKGTPLDGAQRGTEGYSWPKRTGRSRAYRSIHDHDSVASGSVRDLTSDFTTLDDLNPDTGRIKHPDLAARLKDTSRV